MFRLEQLNRWEHMNEIKAYVIYDTFGLIGKRNDKVKMNMLILA